MELALNGIPVLEGSLTIPRVGAWSASLRLDTSEGITGAVELTTQDGASLRGFVTRGGAAIDGRVMLWIIGGAGGLGRVLEPRHYRAPLARLPLLDLVREAGEQIADPLPADTEERLRAQLRGWTRDRTSVTHSLRQFAEALGLVWRVQLDGKLWIGRETWPELVVEGLEVMRDEPAHGRVEVAAVTLPTALVPGTTWEGQRVSLVEHRLSDRSARTTVHFEGEGAAVDRLRATFEASVRSALPFHAFAPMYMARVVRQNDDDTLELVPDDPHIPAMSGVRLKLSIPGKVRVASGARVLLGFENGSPTSPYASLFESGSLERAEIGAATLGVARETDAVDGGRLVTVGGDRDLYWLPPGAGNNGWLAVPNQALPPVLASDGRAIPGQITGHSTKVFAE